MMIFAYDKDGIIVTDQVPKSNTTTAAYYQKFICSVLLPQIQKLGAKKIDGGVLILHDIAEPHVAQPVVNLFIDYTWEALRHPPYSPYLSSPDLHILPQLIEPLRRIV